MFVGVSVRLLPVVDSMNHSCTRSNVEVHLKSSVVGPQRQSRDYMVVSTTRAVHPGEELLLQYSSGEKLANVDFVMRYGFCPDDNADDVVPVDPRAAWNSLVSELRRSFASRQCCATPFNTWTAMVGLLRQSRALAVDMNLLPTEESCQQACDDPRFGFHRVDDGCTARTSRTMDGATSVQALPCLRLLVRVACNAFTSGALPDDAATSPEHPLIASRLAELQSSGQLDGDLEDTHAKIGLILHSVNADEALERMCLLAIARDTVTSLPVISTQNAAAERPLSGALPIDHAARDMFQHYHRTLLLFLD
eukprot:m.1037461 g.1037461  ORF g.1037461 m.1037461 type:complete len:308 (+) comp24143_c0_seq14:1669-2592(+)